MQCDAACCSVLQCVAVCCSVLQLDAVCLRCLGGSHQPLERDVRVQHTATHCIALQRSCATLKCEFWKCEFKRFDEF